jgi:[protein-PII] uridylyltransferase
LLHDIGKGRPEDHSILGAQIARRWPRGWADAEECETVEWLVRYHLLMSDMAQKRDIGDPRTVRDFAKAVKTRKRLDLLTVLTVCDIRGVGPGTWNNWKAMLLRQLYRDTAERAGRRAGGAEPREARGRGQARLREALADWDRSLRCEHETRHYAPYWQGLTDRDAGRLCPPAARAGATTRSASTCTPTRTATPPAPALRWPTTPASSRAWPGRWRWWARTWWMRAPIPRRTAMRPPSSGCRTSRATLRGQPACPACADDRATLKGEVVAREALKDRDKVKKREREFRFPTHITFDNEGPRSTRSSRSTPATGPACCTT